MFFWRRPDLACLERVLAAAANAPFNYDARHVENYFRNETIVMLPAGSFAKATTALRRWQVTNLGWCEFLSLDDEPQAGRVLAARASHLGFWSLHPSRIIGVEDQEQLYSFTIRTLEGHDECGEERFELQALPSGEVRFTIRSYSRPARLAGWLALPYVRHLQSRFGREAAHVMQTLMSR